MPSREIDARARRFLPPADTGEQPPPRACAFPRQPADRRDAACTRNRLARRIDGACLHPRHRTASRRRRGERRVSIDLKHFAPTPEAIGIAIEVECIEVQKRRSVWSIVARDEVDEIGRARHERMIVESIRFAGSLAAKEKLLAQART